MEFVLGLAIGLGISLVVALLWGQVAKLNQRGDEQAREWTAEEILKREG